MPPERFDWSERPPSQPAPSPAGYAPVGPAHAGLAQAGPPAAPGSPAVMAAGQPDGSAASTLVVRTQRSEHTLQPGTVYRVGRDPKSEISIADSRVSWHHGVLRVDGDKWVFEDGGSTNGTFLGQQKVDRVEISNECVVHLGNPDDGPVLRCVPEAAPAGLNIGTVRAAPFAPFAPAAPAPAGPPTPVEPIAPIPSAGPAGGSPWWSGSSAETGGPSSGSAAPPVAPRTPAPWPEAVPQPEPARGGPPAGPPVSVPSPNLLPSVDLRPTSRMQLPTKSLRIGRVPDNDVVLPDLDVSRHHAELRRLPTGGYQIVDLGSHNGTYVNGRRVNSATLTEQDIVSIGHSTFRMAGGELRQFVDDGLVTFAAQDLVVRVGGGKVLLDHVTFPIPEKCLLGVIGPSGAGKSTLLGALTGTKPADTGTVLYDNRDLYQDYAELRYRIGLVPQESVLHTQLTARRALQYSAELRFPADTGAAERDQRVDEVMGELGLTKHANTRADRLSGGQLKRVNVAQELLTRPSLLFLDEPTSGLDPGLDKSVMEQMKDLAHDGRTVIVVTHSVDNLDQCDRLLVLVPGGRIAFYGPPSDGLTYFGKARWAEVFQDFERYPDRDWAAEYMASPAYAQYVLGQRPKPQVQRQGPLDAQEAPVHRRGAFQQMTTLTKRYVRVIASDRGFLLFTGLTPLLLGVLIRLLAGKQGLANTPGNTNATTVLILLVICAVLSGTASSLWEIVKERAIYRRERSAGLSSGAYLASKLVVLGAISIIQSAVFVLIGLGGVKGPSKGAGSLPPLVEILIAIAVLGLASMCLGLLVSALVSTSEKAVPFLVMLTLLQVVLSGGLLKLGTGLKQFAYIAPSRWGFGAAASTINFNAFQAAKPIADSFYDPTAADWLRDVVALIGLAALFSLITWIRLNSLGPRRRKATKEQAPGAPAGRGAHAAVR
ncbi:MAG: FHA domain-containing protein [Streptosporangiaceae bacterium]